MSGWDFVGQNRKSIFLATNPYKVLILPSAKSSPLLRSGLESNIGRCWQVLTNENPGFMVGTWLKVCLHLHIVWTLMPPSYTKSRCWSYFCKSDFLSVTTWQVSFKTDLLQKSSYLSCKAAKKVRWRFCFHLEMTNIITKMLSRGRDQSNRIKYEGRLILYSSA